MTKKMWSRPTWFFFHGFAEKINEEFYRKNYILCWNNIIKTICNNLPCPICKSHASKYISTVKHGEINTKERLKLYLFNFHNSVNRHLGYRKYNYNELEKYKRLHIIRTFNMMYVNLTRQYYGDKMYGWVRKRELTNTLSYMKKIINYYT